jgi:hypothetical protein
MNFPTAATIALSLTVLATGFAQTDSARELKQIQEQHARELAAAVAPIDRRYEAALEQLLRRAIQVTDLDTTKAIRTELEKMGVTASTTGGGKESIFGSPDEVKRAALRAHLRDSDWKFSTGGKSFTLHANGTTSSSWHGKTGAWKVTGPNTADLAISNSGRPLAFTFDEDAKTATGPDGETAFRVSP